MAEIEMPPEYVGSEHDAADTKHALRTPLYQHAYGRINKRFTYIADAVDEFASASVNHINQLKEYDAKAEFSFGTVIEGFISVVGTVTFPEAEIAKIAFETGAKMMVNGLEQLHEQSRDHSISHAVDRMHNEVATLSNLVRVRATGLTDQVTQQLAAAVDQALTQVESVENSPEYLGLLCDWMGFTEPTRQNTIDPVRQRLENDFIGLWAQVKAELLRDGGRTGLDDSQLNPQIWAGEAERYERELYRKEGEEAWQDAYKESE